MPVFQLVDAALFPPTNLAEENGLLAVGGDLREERLLLAYEMGIFPWYNDDQPILWWSPPKRMMLYPGKMRVSKSLGQSIRNKGYKVSLDTAFEDVIRACQSTKRKGEGGTWINDKLIQAYQRLHVKGYAHSVECWLENELVGGLYGVSLGKAFFGESMFSAATDASKVALHHLHQFVERNDMHFIDCQLHTDHLASLGAVEISREQYETELKTALAFPDMNHRWQ